MRCVSPWYNRTGWPGVKNQLTYLPPKHIYTPHPALARMSTLPEPWSKRKKEKNQNNNSRTNKTTNQQKPTKQTKQQQQQQKQPSQTTAQRQESVNESQMKFNTEVSSVKIDFEKINYTVVEYTE